MTPESASPPRQDEAIDWGNAQAFLLACVRHRLARVSADVHEELAQIALVELLRTSRREPVRSAEALMNTLADHAVTDFMRHRRRWSLLVEAMDDSAHTLVADPSANPPEPGDPLARLRFVVLEYFVTEHAPCAELARDYFAETSWKDVAARTGTSHNTILQRWSRCVKRLRRAARSERNPILGWCHE